MRVEDVTGDATARGLANRLGITVGAELTRVVLGGAMYGSTWVGFRSEMLGVSFTVQPGAPNPPGPVFRLGAVRDGQDLAVQLWAQWVHYEESRVYAESTWHPTRGQTYSIRGLEHDHRKADVDRAWRSLRLVKLTERLGRPPDKTRDLVVEAIQNAVRALRRRRLRPTARALMAEMSIGKSQFYDDNARLSIDWRQVVRETATG